MSSRRGGVKKDGFVRGGGFVSFSTLPPAHNYSTISHYRIQVSIMSRSAGKGGKGFLAGPHIAGSFRKSGHNLEEDANDLDAG